MAEAGGHVSDRSRADRRAPAAGPGAVRQRRGADLRLLRSGARRTGVRRVDQDPRGVPIDPRLVHARHRHRSGVGDLHQPRHQRATEVPVLGAALPTRRLGARVGDAPGRDVSACRGTIGRAADGTRELGVRRQRVVDQGVAGRRRGGGRIRPGAPGGAGRDGRNDRGRGADRGRRGPGVLGMGSGRRPAAPARPPSRPVRREPDRLANHRRRRPARPGGLLALDRHDRRVAMAG